MLKSFLGFLRVGVRSRLLRPETRLVPAVTWLNVDGLDLLVKYSDNVSPFFLNKQTLYSAETLTCDLY